jgi:hypothetical protein
LFLSSFFRGFYAPKQLTELLCAKPGVLQVLYPEANKHKKKKKKEEEEKL